jgi:methyltransferase (TIGR00027 family)
MRFIPNISMFGLQSVSAGTLWANELTGYVPKIYRYPYPGEPEMGEQNAARTTYFDQAMQRHLGHVEQLVFLGAGFDTRSYRLPASTKVRCFEVDAPKTQAFKRELLAKAGIDATRVTFVPANFLTDDWLENLIAAGFDPGKPSFFLWEAVTPYLDQPSVESTLRKIATTAPGSAVAFDYLSTQLLANRSPFWLYARAVLNVIGEPFGTFGIDNTPPVKLRVAAFLASCGLILEEQKNFGHETATRGAADGFAVGVVPFKRTAESPLPPGEG